MAGRTFHGRSISRWSGLAALAAAGLVFSAVLAFRTDAQPRPRAIPVRVIGTLYATAPAPAQAERRGPTEIELPDAKVFLTDGRGRRLAEAKTWLDGRFELLAPAPGSYRICYEVGALKGCGPTVRPRDATFPAGRVAVEGRPSIYGRVLTGDGRPCWVSDSFFNLDVSTQVSASKSGATTRPSAVTRANVQGEYALFGVKSGRYIVAARCEGAVASSPLTLASGQAALDLTLPNRAPAIRSAGAREGQIGRYRGLVGATLDLQADVSDPDGDTVQYIWRALDHAGQVASGGGPAAQWKLPADTGYRSVYLIARDGRGGFAYNRIDLDVARDNRVGASGRAIDEATGRPIRGATVTLGTGRGETDDNGWFSVTSDRRRDERYVLNIDHGDYALLSRIVDRSVRGNTYELTPAQVSQQPAGAMVLVDRSSGGFCGQPAGGRERPLARRDERRVIVPPGSRQDARGLSAERLLHLSRQQDAKCIRRGAQVVVPAGALVDGRGRGTTGPVRAAITTLNPARRSLPGDYEAIGTGGDPAGLLSFGAVDVQFRDAAGKPLELRDGAAAKVRIPVPPSQAASAQPEIRIWSYNAEEGRWEGEGKAVLEQTPEGAFYVGETRHFSVINMDIELNPANATCVRVKLDPAFGAWTDLTLRAYASFANGTSVQVKETPLNTEEFHRIAALPYGSGFPPNTLRLELRGTFNGVQQVLLDNIINTDARLQMDPKVLLFPPPDYEQCGTPVILSPAAGVLPYYGDIDGLGRPAFLIGPTGSFNPNTPQAAAYYATIDPPSPLPLKDTLGKWWNENGFGADGQGAGNASFTRASYMNHNDLGFGRDMHCLTRPPVAPSPLNRLACYVTNYGAPDQNDQNSLDAESRNPATQGATVTMEFDPNAGAAAVQFYVFGGGVSASQRLLFADLDGLGPKPVPHLCMVCHGGTFSSNKVQNARFREFDLPSFRYSGARTWDFNDSSLSPAELAAFARLNNMVLQAHAAPIPIGALIEAWYPSGFAGGPAPEKPDEPDGWDNSASQKAGYHAVYGTTCRTCHIARDEGNPTAFYVFGDYDNFKSPFVKNAVCGSGNPKYRVMPNAYITYRNFWADSARVLTFEALMDPAASNCGS